MRSTQKASQSGKDFIPSNTENVRQLYSVMPFCVLSIMPILNSLNVEQRVN